MFMPILIQLYYLPSEHERNDMTDSTDNTNELDSYGVWVKRPSKAFSGETPENSNAENPIDNFNIDADLPDFSEIDISSVTSDVPEDTSEKLEDDTTLSTKELSDITGTINTADLQEHAEEAVEEDDTSRNPEKNSEVSLEDFLDEGFSDSSEPPADSQDFAVKDKEPAANEESEDISLDDFLDSDFSTEEAEKQNKEPDEAPLDINLSFSTDEPSGGNPESVLSEAESVDSADFGIPPEEKNGSADTDAVSSGDSDDMFNSFADKLSDSENSSAFFSDTPAEETEPLIHSDSAMETEDIDLSDFGVDAEAEETPVTTNLADNKPKSTTVDFDLAVTEEDSAAPAPVVSEIKSAAPGSDTVPDSFEEESKSLISTSSEKAESISETTSVSNALLQQIVADLSGLKNEISSLKNDFAELKAHEEIIAAGTQKQPKGGFFADEEDDDDTISLSGDELDNIMNTADFTNNAKEESIPAQKESVEQTEENPVSEYEETTGSSDETEVVSHEETGSEQEPADDNLFGTIDSSVPVPETPAVDDTTVSNLTMNFDSEKLEEPDLNDLASTTSDEMNQDELPEEISIPKVDDILVESSPTDFMDSVKDTTETPSADEEIHDISENEETAAAEESAESADKSDSEENEKQEEAPSTIPEDIFSKEPSVSTTLTKDNIDYLNTDEVAKKELESASTSDSLSDISDSEGKVQNLPDGLTQEVKSVLLYMDQLLENLPEDKIIEFARSEHFATYKKLFSDLGLS
jgi:pilus assembly protein FimV